MKYQMEKSITIIKALADNSRLLILNTLIQKSSYVEELSQKLNLAASTISFHLKKLEEAGLIKKIKLQYYSIFTVNEDIFNSTLRDLISFENSEVYLQNERLVKYKEKVFTAFFENNKLIKLPAQLKKRLLVLDWFASNFMFNKNYTELEVNEIIRVFFDDYCTIRRQLIEYGYMIRYNGIYKLQKNKYEQN